MRLVGRRNEFYRTVGDIVFNVTDKFLSAITDYERSISCKLDFGSFTIPNENIKSINIDQSIASGDFEIGTVNAASFDAAISALNDPEYLNMSFKNYYVDVYIGVMTADGSTDYIPVGKYKIISSETEGKVITIKGYDNIVLTDITYIPADIYPNTLRAVAEDIAALCELRLSDTPFPNEDLLIESMPYWGDITCRTALGYVAEAAGACFIADRYGNIKAVNYSAPVCELTAKDYFALKLGESDFNGIKSIYINYEGKELAWDVNGTEDYTINNNPLLSDKDIANEALQGLKDGLRYSSYRPFELDYICNPALDVGDGITVYDIDGNTYKSVIHSINISFDGGLRSTIAAYADDSVNERSSSGQSYGEQISAADKKASEAKNTADEAKKTADEAKAAVDSLPEIAVNVVETNVVKSDIMQTTWCLSKYMLVQFLETNFEALDINKPYQRLRKYIRIFDDNIKVVEAELSADETEYYKDPNGQKLYWTAITGENAFKFFTYTSPLTIAKSERPEGITDNEFEDMYTVKVRKTVSEYVKASLGFSLNSAGTGEPELSFGAGDESGNGKYYFTKDADSGRFVYTSRIDGKERGIAIKDDGVYQVMGELFMPMHPIAVVGNMTEAEALPEGTIVFAEDTGGN